VFGFVGRLVEEKSIDTLLSAYAEYVAQTRRKTHLVIAGDGPLREGLIKHAGNLKIDVKFLGFRADVPELMSAFDVFVLSSVTEGFGLVLLEAMAAGTAIITTNVGAIPEVVDDSAVVVNPRRPGEIAAAMRQYENEEFRHAFEIRGTRRLQDNFSLDKMFAQTDQVYQEAIKNRTKA